MRIILATACCQIVQNCWCGSGVRWDPKVNEEHGSVVVKIKHPFRTKKVDGETVLRTESEYETAWVETLDRAVKRALI